ncbi:hypothetical protein WKW79_20190 [Variovorax robiniae]|uniref:Uncharacterized protein n=1 Tax=Variovorax robiniae TaxID=1836199 RepID=A0ABU8XB10_9BURK
MKLTWRGAVQVIAFISLTLLATALLVAAGLNEANALPGSHSASHQPHGGPG